jgi:hypothetical protein
VVQHHQGVEAEEEHHLQAPQVVEVAAVVHLVPAKQAPEEGEGEALRGHHGPEAEGAGGHLVLQRQAAEAAEGR